MVVVGGLSAVSSTGESHAETAHANKLHKAFRTIAHELGVVFGINVGHLEVMRILQFSDTVVQALNNDCNFFGRTLNCDFIPAGREINANLSIKKHGI